MKYRTLTIGYKPPIAYITLNRPRASNRVNLIMAIEMRQLCQQLREQHDVYVAILTGKGTVFCSGRESLSLARRARQGHAPESWLELHRAASALARIEIPTVAAINGDALDHGLEMALACDLRIATRGGTLGITDLARGVVPWDGGTQRLPRLVGRGRALEMLLTSRLIEAEEARRIGLVNMIVEPWDLKGAADKLALEIASGAPIPTRYAKEAVLKGMDMSLEQGLGLEADLSILLQSTADRAEGLRSFHEKREPKFSGE